jgi:hypothetical protein
VLTVTRFHEASILRILNCEVTVLSTALPQVIFIPYEDGLFIRKLFLCWFTQYFTDGINRQKASTHNLATHVSLNAFTSRIIKISVCLCVCVYM